MNSNHVIVGVIGLALGVLVGALLGGSLPGFGRGTGPVHYQTESFLQGLAAGTRDQFYVENDGDVVTSGDLTVSGGSLTLTHTNTATSSVVVGCKQSYPTSTATAIKETYVAIATSSVSNTGSAPNGFVTWQYGTCP